MPAGMISMKKRPILKVISRNVPQYFRRGSRVNVGKAERVVSVTAALPLVWLGFKRRGVARLLFFVSAYSVLKRGLTGHCRFYERLHLSTARR